MEQNGDIIDMSRPVTVLARDTVYQGAVFSVEDMRLALHARDGGDIVVRRQVMRHAPCVVMLVHDTANDRYLMEREYRAGSDLFAYGLPAGLMDAGEDVMDAALRPAEGAGFEYHHLYADLQIDLAGCEYWAWTAQAQPTVPFDPAADCGFVAGPEQSSGLLGEGRFALFLPGEYHKPSCISPVSTAVRKAVVKIRMGG